MKCLQVREHRRSRPCDIQVVILLLALLREDLKGVTRSKASYRSSAFTPLPAHDYGVFHTRSTLEWMYNDQGQTATGTKFPCGLFSTLIQSSKREIHQSADTFYAEVVFGRSFRTRHVLCVAKTQRCLFTARKRQLISSSQNPPPPFLSNFQPQQELTSLSALPKQTHYIQLFTPNVRLISCVHWRPSKRSVDASSCELELKQVKHIAARYPISSPS